MEPALRLGEIPARPLLKPWYRLSSNDSGVILRFGGSVLTFEGRAAVRLMPHLLPLLDGAHDVDGIVAELGEPARPAVLNALELLASRRLLIEPVADEPPAATLRTAELLAACSVAELPLGRVAGALAAARVVVRGEGGAAAGAAALLRDSGVGSVEARSWEEAGEFRCDLVVAAPASDEVFQLEAWNKRALETATPWLQVLPFDGSVSAVGPVFVPHESACYECYRLRRSANTSPVPDRERGPFVDAPALDAVLAGLAALTAVRWLAAGDGGCVGELLAVELIPEIAMSRSILFRVPRCPACSPAGRRGAPAPWHGAFDAAA